MHNNAYLTYICTYIHIFTHITHIINTYKHIFYMKIPHNLDILYPYYAYGSIVWDTRVNLLQLVRLQVTLIPFEFVGVLSPKVDPHTL